MHSCILYYSTPTLKAFQLCSSAVHLVYGCDGTDTLLFESVYTSHMLYAHNHSLEHFLRFKSSFLHFYVCNHIDLYWAVCFWTWYPSYSRRLTCPVDCGLLLNFFYLIEINSDLFKHVFALNMLFFYCFLFFFYCQVVLELHQIHQTPTGLSKAHTVYSFCSSVDHICCDFCQSADRPLASLLI